MHQALINKLIQAIIGAFTSRDRHQGVEMHQLKYFVAAVLLLFAHSACADMFDVRLSNDSARFSYSAELSGGQRGPLDLDMGVFFNKDNDKIAHVGLMVRNDTLDNPLVISVGVRAYYGDVGNKVPEPHSKFTAIAIGGELLFIPNNLGGLGFGLNYYVAPSVVSYHDADGFTEYGVGINYEISNQADISLSYQKTKVDLKNGGSLDVDSSVYFGVGLRF